MTVCIYAYGHRRTTVEQTNNSTGTVLYLHHDQQGSTRLLTGSTGKAEGECSYSAYGAPTCEGTTTALGYDGQYTNSDTGLIYLRAREYDPATAQFLSVDPLAKLTGAPYSYAGDNPVNEADRSGLISFGTVLSVASFVGTGVVCLVPGLNVIGCGPAIAVNALIQTGLVVTSSRSPGEKVALVLTNALLANGATLFYATDELMAEAAAPGWVTGFLKTLGAIVPSLPNVLELAFTGCN